MAEPGAPVIFQDVVPFFERQASSSSRGGVKVEITGKYFQGADLSRRLLHRPCSQACFPAWFGWEQRLDHLQPPLLLWGKGE